MRFEVQMSYGERSCINYGKCTLSSCMSKCDVNCVKYASNGKKPDTKRFQSAVAAVKLFSKKKLRK